ncbi:hypothetical protein D9M71_559710 [compost metagenome]
MKPFILIIGLDGPPADLAQRQQPVSDDQQVLFRRVFEAVDNAFLGGQAGHEVEVCFTGLHAKFAHLMRVETLQLVGIHALAFEHDLENLRHGFLLEDAPVRAQPGAGQHGLDQCPVTGAMEACFPLAEGADQAVHVAQRALTLPEGEQHRFVEELAEVDIVFETDQLQLQLER